MRARDKELGRPVAIKEMLHPGLPSELRFFREALAKNPHAFGSRIVFVHTGGIFGLFPATKLIASVL
jgi:hypothetical protein